MDTYGLIGWPLGHSFSASFFAEKFRNEGLDAQYLNFEMEHVEEGLPELIASTPTLRGLNVTIPHKQAVIPLLDEIAPEARAIGAVNVIRICRRRNGKALLKGYNTDVIGFTISIMPLLRETHKRALVLGTGGASKAVVYGLESLGVATTYVSRTPAKGRLTYADLTPEVLKDFTVIVNCSPVGMFPHVDECPQLPYEALTPEHLLYDLVYNPAETLFLKRGAEQGAATKNGLDMLHLQALAGWDLWHNG